jgi:hypothetical protein
MKKSLFFTFLCTFYGAAFATTVNYNWLVDGNNYMQTTCETGDDLILPTPAPTKYGYHFVGWVEEEIFGSWSQSGTPTPQNPIEPVFTPFGNTVLRAVGSGNDFVADSYDPETRVITRRIGVRVLDGTEDWVQGAQPPTFKATFNVIDSQEKDYQNCLCSHFKVIKTSMTLNVNDNQVAMFTPGNASNFDKIVFGKYDIDNLKDWKQWIADQYNAGTPVTIYYPLKTPVTENYTATSISE